MEKIPFNRKLYDTVQIAPAGRVDDHWSTSIISNVFEGKRAAAEKDTSFRFYDPEYLIKRFGLLGFEFGNWLNQEDRYIYLAGAAYGMKDFCELFKIKSNQFGLMGRISIALGARGHSASLAHFEPSTFAINITRYRRGTASGNDKYLGKSGAGSLGHEYAHALDFYAGRYIDTGGDYNFLTETLQDVFVYSHTAEGQTFYKYTEPRRSATYDLRKTVVDGLGALMYEKVDGNTYTETKFYADLQRYIEETQSLGKYWLKIIEIFARSYEVFLYKKCTEKGIEESFLKKKKYKGELYPDIKLFTPAIEKAYTDFTKMIIDKSSELPF